MQIQMPVHKDGANPQESCFPHLELRQSYLSLSPPFFSEASNFPFGLPRGPKAFPPSILPFHPSLSFFSFLPSVFLSLFLPKMRQQLVDRMTFGWLSYKINTDVSASQISSKTQAIIFI